MRYLLLAILAVALIGCTATADNEPPKAPKVMPGGPGVTAGQGGTGTTAGSSTGY